MSADKCMISFFPRPSLADPGARPFHLLPVPVVRVAGAGAHRPAGGPPVVVLAAEGARAGARVAEGAGG